MNWHTFTVTIPWPSVSAGWIAAWLLAGNATLIALIATTMFNDDPDWGFVNIVAAYPPRRGIALVALVLAIWPVVLTMIIFVEWFIRSGRADDLERKRHSVMDDDI